MQEEEGGHCRSILCAWRWNEDQDPEEL
jgi:hypothetical protein